MARGLPARRFTARRLLARGFSAGRFFSRRLLAAGLLMPWLTPLAIVLRKNGRCGDQ